MALFIAWMIFCANGVCRRGACRHAWHSLQYDAEILRRRTGRTGLRPCSGGGCIGVVRIDLSCRCDACRCSDSAPESTALYRSAQKRNFGKSEPQEAISMPLSLLGPDPEKAFVFVPDARLDHLEPGTWLVVTPPWSPSPSSRCCSATRTVRSAPWVSSGLAYFDTVDGRIDDNCKVLGVVIRKIRTVFRCCCPVSNHQVLVSFH